MKLLVRMLLQIVAVMICLCPTWLFILLRHMLDPEGFWQKLVFLVLGIIFLGALQLLGLFGIFMSVLFLWFNSDVDSSKARVRRIPRPKVDWL